jgi:hypothetical protein
VGYIQLNLNIPHGFSNNSADYAIETPFFFL